MQREVASGRHAGTDRRHAALILGVTPELAALDWPKQSRVYAVDRSMEMIRSIWYVSAPHASGAGGRRLGEPAVREGSFDLVLGDGCFAFWSWPDGFRRLRDEAARVLKPGGRLIVRFQVRPEVGETPTRSSRIWPPDESADSTRSNGASSSPCMATTRAGCCSLTSGMRGSNSGVDRRTAGRGAAMAPRGDPDDHAYQKAQIRYFFPRADELRALLGERFDEIACHTPGYENGERYRIIALERPA